jgi:hypothetical protein
MTTQTPDVVPIAQRLEAARRDLLDLSLRNQLLNHRPSKARGVAISDELPATAYRLLWDEERSFTFAPSATAEEAGEQADPPAPPAPGEEVAARHRDTRLQTAHPAERLQARLLATARDARFVEEEQGVNVLFLALGFLRWREEDASTQGGDGPWRLAPLCLVPVRLARSRADAQFALCAADADPLGNLTLAVKLKADLGITLPELPAVDGLDLEAWFAQVATAVSTRAGWTVERRIALDLFAFGRHLMWRDLDPAAWPNGAGPAERPLVARLFGGGFKPLPPVGRLDETRPPERVGEVVESDGSQGEALAAVAAGSDLVIQGPPGTGKSQTICNLIAEAAAAGKTALFVAEKMAALSVVQRRLESVGLGALCLELHSDKAAKRAVLGEVGRTLKGEAPAPAPGGELDRGYAALRAELGDFAEAMALPIGRSGISPGAALDRLAALGAVQEAGLPADAFPDDDAPMIASQDAALSELTAGLARTGPLTAHPWGAARLTTLLPESENRIIAAVAVACAALEPARCAGAALAVALGAAAPAGPAAAARLLAAARHVAARPAGVADPESAAGAAAPGAPPPWFGGGALDQLFAAGDAYAGLRAQHATTLIPEAWEQDLSQVRADLAAYGEGLFRWVSGAWRAAHARLKGLCLVGRLPTGHAAQVALTDAVLAARRHAAAVRARDGLGTALFGSAWRGAESDWAQLTRARAWATAWNQGRAQGWPCCQRLDAADAVVAAQQPALAAWETAELALRSALAAGAEDLSWQAWETRLQAQAGGCGTLHDVCAVNRSAEPLAALPAVLAAVRTWNRPVSELADALRAARLNALLNRALAERPALARFDPAAHDRARVRFAQLDRAVLAANRLRIAHGHRQRLPAATEGGAAALLRRESEKKMRHLPLRTLLRDAGAAVQRVKPVFLMSPLSVAAYLEPGGLQFDLVVFDEASQVRPVDAVGALARGRQLVVVGDSKQMPPTSFFDRLVGGDADGENGEEAGWASDLESVLGLCLGSGCPSLMLRWHYRSRHPSLIATSNRCFYENKLRTFPSPAGAPRPDGDGLTLCHLPDATYDRAKSRTNAREAAAVAEAVMAHATATPQLSLGVAAFSQAQMLAIAGEVERRRRLDGSAEAFFASHPNEPFFVKNLENVQGDERDVILVSVGYGRDTTGTVNLNFGPLNTDGGERRLNVLITRARRRLRVFTNLTPEDIDERRTQAKGVLALKEFLAYARSGAVQAAQAGTVGGVAARLMPPGAEGVSDDGVAWRLGDLAVRIDDAVWCAAATCRDRERLQDEVLTGLGWQVHHAWRLGWWRRPEEELRRIAAARKPDQP